MRVNLRFEGSLHDKYKSPFRLGREQRQLRLVLDPRGATKADLFGVLKAFARHEELNISSPEPGASNFIEVNSSANGDEVSSSSYGDLAIQVTSAESVLRTAAWVSDHWRFAKMWLERAGSDPSESWEAFVVAHTAKALHADALITEDPLLLDGGQWLPTGINVVEPEDGVALVGSFLRRRSDFTISAERLAGRIATRGLFYWTVMRELLPEGWRWFSSAVYGGDEPTRRSLTNLAGSALSRMEQALKARDHVHWQCFMEQDNGAADEALFYLDMMLLSLSGAFDVVARYADRVLDIGTPREQISWRRKAWVRELRTECPPLAALMTGTTRGKRVHEVISCLRNSIHGEALRTIAYQQSRTTENLLILPEDDRAQLTDHLEQLGGLENWGYEDLGGTYACVRPAMFVEQLIPLAFAVLNSVMAATPVERIDGLDATLLSTGPPEGDEMWSSANRRAFRILVGL